jgi:hypothetical protein
LVVPRSMPIVFAMLESPLLAVLAKKISVGW